METHPQDQQKHFLHQIVIDPTTQTCRCLQCNEEIPLPLGRIEWVTGVLKSFSKVHKNCKETEVHKPPLCYFSPKE